MDEKIRELMEQYLFERAQAAYEQMLEANPRLREIVHESAALSGEIENNTAIDAESKALVQRFLSLSSDADYEYQRYLYIQGAKDCVAVLRELGVIK